jgi:hypothetical protein
MIPHHKVQKSHLLAATQAPHSHSFSLLTAVLGIPIRIRIRMFLGLPYLIPDLLSHKHGSGSGSLHHQAKILRKTLISTVLWLLFDFLFLKNDENVPRTSDPDPEDPYVFGPPGSSSGSVSQRYGSGSVPTCHESPTLLSGKCLACHFFSASGIRITNLWP